MVAISSGLNLMPNYEGRDISKGKMADVAIPKETEPITTVSHISPVSKIRKQTIELKMTELTRMDVFLDVFQLREAMINRKMVLVAQKVEL